MFEKTILVGYEINTSNPIKIPFAHLVVTGVTQQSGKTTTLEALIKRSSDYKAIAFKTKIGEKGFSQGTEIVPFYKEQFNWEYVYNLLEAIAKEKLKFEKAWVIRLCKDVHSLKELHSKIKKILKTDDNARQLFGRKLSSLDENVMHILNAYLDKIIPELEYSNLGNELNLENSINIMNLTSFSDEMKSLIIDSVLIKVLNEMTHTIIILPEAWKLIPQGLGNPCKRSVISYIRQGATNKNFLWIDSQDITGVDKAVLKQITIWILGYQSEINEIKRTIDQIPLNRSLKPDPEEISQLQIGHFFVVFKRTVKKVYILPAWLDEETAKNIALGNIDVYQIIDRKTISIKEVIPNMKQDENKTGKTDEKINELNYNLEEIKRKQEEDGADIVILLSTVDEIKNELKTIKNVITNINNQSIRDDTIKKITDNVLRNINIQGNTSIFQISPMEAIINSFAKTAKERLFSSIDSLDSEKIKILLFLETQKNEVTLSYLLERGLLLNSTTQSIRKRISRKCKDLQNSSLISTETDNKRQLFSSNILQYIKFLLEPHGVTEEEILKVYNHVMNRLHESVNIH